MLELCISAATLEAEVPTVVESTLWAADTEFPSSSGGIVEVEAQSAH